MKRGYLAVGALIASSSASFAHVNPLEHGSFAAGFSHPFSGLDHILAMLTVGAWAALVGGKAIWQVPAAFVGTMLAGFAAAILGMPVPFVEPAILASLFVFGLLALTAVRTPTSIALAIIGFFAFFHGHAHGSELGAATALPYAIAFACAAALLHGIGFILCFAAGRVLPSGHGALAGRLVGAASVAGGLFLALS